MPQDIIEFDALTRTSRRRIKLFLRLVLAALVVAHLALITDVISSLREIF